jgi:primosomal protein N' (replication factor Y)
VVFESPLPALDREFEYLVPAALQSEIQLGVRVKVPFARQTKIGYVVGLADHPEYSGKISEVIELVSNVPVLQPHVYSLLRAISARQCCSVGELISSAVPSRSVRVEKSFAYKPLHRAFNPEGIRQTRLVRPFAADESGRPHGFSELANLAVSEFRKGTSVLVVLPDFRDVEIFRAEIAELVEEDSLVERSSGEIGSESYRKFLKQLNGDPLIVFGTRNTIYSPVPSSASVIIWEDSDQSHIDQQSPYLNTREIALLRQKASNANLFFLGHSRSTEVQRLVQIGYLASTPSQNWRPKVLSFHGPGLDSGSYSLIKRGLESGPVLVQVAAPGISRSLYCAGCSERSACVSCNGPLWLNASGHAICRWCGRSNLDFKCRSCAGSKLRQGGAGATRWATQLGKSFPGVVVREVTSEDRIPLIKETRQIIVATPGIEPIVQNGYSAVLVIDGYTALGRDSLRASEDALRSWLTALSFMRSKGEAGIIGLTAEVERAFTLGEVEEVIGGILAEREQLGFPPARRVLSAMGQEDLLEQLEKRLSNIDGVKVLGIAKAKTSTAENDSRLVATFTYASGVEVASEVRTYLASIAGSANRVSVKSGRAIRPISIRFDDPQVI